MKDLEYILNKYKEEGFSEDKIKKISEHLVSGVQGKIYDEVYMRGLL